MTPELTPHQIANEIKHRQIFSPNCGEGKTFVMVEGKTDEVLWEEFRSREDCTLYPTQGKEKIIAALDITNNRGLAGVAGIVDADYELIRESDRLHLQNLLYDECFPDAELMILNSAALTDVLKKKFYRDDDPDIKKLADLLQAEAERLAMEFGYFRLLNDCNRYYIDFKEFWNSRRYDFEEFIDAADIDSIRFRRDCFAIRLAKFHNAGRKRGQDQWIEHGELLAGVAELKETDKYKTPNIKLCQGHETVALIAHLLPIMFKSVFGHDLPPNFSEFRHRLKLEENLRNNYKEEEFVTTTLCDAIKNWECSNNPYKILRPEM